MRHVCLLTFFTFLLSGNIQSAVFSDLLTVKLDAGYFSFDRSLSADTSPIVLNQSKNKSRTKAVLLSSLLPGTGDLYLSDWNLNQWGKGQYFFFSEVLLISTVTYLYQHSQWIRRDSRLFASAHAGVLWNNRKPPKYSTTIGKFPDIYAYNETQRRLTGTAFLMPETPEFYWRWDSDKNRKKYDNMRARSLSERNAAIYLIYGVLANHLLSVVHTSHRFNVLIGNHSFTSSLMYLPVSSSGGISHGLCLTLSPVSP